jgi:hypothetical protein
MPRCPQDTLRTVALLARPVPPIPYVPSGLCEPFHAAADIFLYGAPAPFTGSRVPVIRPCSGLREGYAGYRVVARVGYEGSDARCRERVTASGRSLTCQVILNPGSVVPVVRER